MFVNMLVNIVVNIDVNIFSAYSSSNRGIM
jgi:hypothetical protein